MRSPASAWCVPFVLVALMAGCTQAPPAPPPVDQAAIGAAIDALTPAFSAALAAKDTNAVVNFYADDAHVLAPNMPRADGKDAIRQAWVGFLSIPGAELLPVSNTKMISEAGDMVVELGSYTFKGMDPKGQPMSDTGKYATVFKKVNGEWKIVVDTWNSDMAIPGM